MSAPEHVLEASHTTTEVSPKLHLMEQVHALLSNISSLPL